jgi:hypothetical protein
MPGYSTQKRRIVAPVIFSLIVPRGQHLSTRTQKVPKVDSTLLILGPSPQPYTLETPTTLEISGYDSLENVPVRQSTSPILIAEGR